MVSVPPDLPRLFAVISSTLISTKFAFPETSLLTRVLAVAREVKTIESRLLLESVTTALDAVSVVT